MSLCSYLLPHPTLALMAPIDYFVMFAHCSSVEYVRLTRTLGMARALDRGQRGLFGADTVLRQWNFQTFSAASSRVLGTVILSLLFFFLHVHTPLRVIFLHFY